MQFSAKNNADKPTNSAIGKPMDRTDERLKVTGAARYAAEFPIENLAPSGSRLPEKTTFAPAVPSARAVALPIPDVAPVTKATLFSSVIIPTSALKLIRVKD
jgi:hypothetical protein